MNQFNVSRLQERFKGQDYVTKNDLQLYFEEQEPQINESTLRWRIHNLKENKVIRPIKRGVYAFTSHSSKWLFLPPASRQIDQLYDVYFSNLDMETCIIWTTEWLAQFMELQPTHHLILFEIGKEMTQPLFFHVKLAKFEAYLDPDRQMMTDYVMAKKNPVIIRPLLSRSPITTNDHGLPVPTLEKILVDLFCDKDIFIAYQGSELKNIFNNAWKNYQLNLSILMNYAQRRRRAKQLTEFLKNSSQELYKALRK